MTSPYKTPIHLLHEGVEASWKNALSLSKAAKLLLSNEYHAIALSLSTLALEELGKIFIMDSMLFAKSGDEKSSFYKKAYLNHPTKLEIIDVFPLVAMYFASLDPRYEGDHAYRTTIAITIEMYRKDRAALSPWLGQECDLRVLDRWKQKGFYADYENESGTHFKSPEEVVSVAFASSVVELTNRCTNLLDFILRDNIQRYRERVESVRENVSEEQLKEISEFARAYVDKVHEDAPASWRTVKET